MSDQHEQPLNSALKEPAPQPGEGVDLAHPARGRTVIVDAEAGILQGYQPDGVTRRKKIAILGFASSTRAMAPFADPEWDMWSLNQLYRHVPRVDRTCDMHRGWDAPGTLVPGTEGDGPGSHRAFLRESGIPAVFIEPPAGFPHAVRYPIDRLIAKFGLDYFTSTVAYWVALAIDEIDTMVADRLREAPRDGLATAYDVLELARAIYNEYWIGVFGIDLAVGEEYCVSPETAVLTDDLRWVEAWTLKSGDTLTAFDESPRDGAKTRRWRRAIVKTSTPLRRPCYRIKLSDGTELISSAEHRWLTQVGDTYMWRRTDKLLVTRSHRRPSRLVRLVDKWSGPIHSWDAGYLAAAFDGEGHLCGNMSRVGTMGLLGYAQKKNAMSEAVEQALSVYGFEWGCHAGEVVDHYGIHGGRSEVMRFLGQMRPRRLLGLFDPDRLGRMHAKSTPSVLAAEYIGERDVIGLGTSTGTFVAEGFASHNSWQKPCAEFWLGQAMARNIQLWIPKPSALLKQQYRYGYDEEPPSIVTPKEILAHQQKLLQQRDEGVKQLYLMEGALDVMRTPPERWKPLDKVQAERDETLKRLIMLEGAMECDEFWHQMVELRLRGSEVH